MTKKGQELYEYAHKMSYNKLYLDVFDEVLTMEAKLENLYQDYQDGETRNFENTLQDSIQRCKDIRKILSKLIWD